LTFWFNATSGLPSVCNQPRIGYSRPDETGGNGIAGTAAHKCGYRKNTPSSAYAAILFAIGLDHGMVIRPGYLQALRKLLHRTPAFWTPYDNTHCRGA